MRSPPTPDDFAERLAAATPTPGGGAAAARAGLLSTSLLRMVSGISLEKAGDDRADPERGELWTRVEEIADESRLLAERFRRLEGEDMEAFESYLAALRLPRADDDEVRLRREALDAATRRATEVPLETLAAGLESLDLAQRLLALAPKVRLRAEADLGGAVELAHAAFRVAELNVLVNLPAIRDERERSTAAARHHALLEDLERNYHDLREQIHDWLRR